MFKLVIKFFIFVKCFFILNESNIKIMDKIKVIIVMIVGFCDGFIFCFVWVK